MDFLILAHLECRRYYHSPQCELGKKSLTWQAPFIRELKDFFEIIGVTLLNFTKTSRPKRETIEICTVRYL